MQRKYLIENERSAVLEVWLEPFCNTYTVPGGSTLTLLYKASPQHGTAVHTIQTDLGLTIYLDAAYEPDAELDGSPVDPD